MERPFDYPGSSATLEDRFEPFTQIGQFTHESEDGESYTRYTTYLVSTLADEAEIAEYVKDQHPSTRCQHEYDCCGRFYGGTAQWQTAPKLTPYSDGSTVTLIVRQSFSANI